MISGSRPFTSFGTETTKTAAKRPYHFDTHPEFSAASGPQVSRRSADGGSIGGEDIRDLRGGPVRVVGVVQQVTPGPAVEPA